MLRITASVNGVAAKNYYNEGLTKEGRESYYRHESAGSWGGRGAARLGLEGAVTREQFEALADNRIPGTEERLTARNTDGRTVGWDFTFSVPKSVSVYYALTGDRRVRDAFETAVEMTMREIESEALTRVRRNGADHERASDGLLWASYTHYNSRPVEGVYDPHLHRHVYLFNGCWDPEESRWKSVYLRETKRDAPYYEAAFDARFAYRLRELGIAVERRSRGGWELAAVPDSVVTKFSRRTAEIEAEAVRQGITSDKEKDRLGARLRKQKEGELDPGTLKREWAARLTPEEAEALAKVPTQRPEHREKAAEVAVERSLRHVLERSSVVRERTLLASSLKHGIGQVRVEDVQKAFAKRCDVIRHRYEGQDMVTTKEVLAEEERMLAFVREGRGRCRPLARPGFALDPGFLNREQTQAVRFVLTTQDRVVGIRGGAGVGKSSLMKVAAEALRLNGHRLHVFAPTAQSSRGVLRREGFQDAETVQKLLADEALQAQVKGGVLWIDEAGLLGSRTLAGIFEVAKEQNARVVLSGDYGQMRSVDRGDAFRFLHQVGGMAMSEVREIQRQKGDYKRAVESIGRGRLEEGFRILEEMGAVQELAGEERYDRLAADYVESVGLGKSAVVVTPTHFEAEQVKSRIRSGLRERGVLEGEDRAFRRLKSLQWTEAEKMDGYRYRVGDVAAFQNHVRGFRKGARVRIEEVERGNVWVRDADGKRQALPLGRAKSFEVFEAKELRLAVGDRLQISKNGSTKNGQHRLNNGAQYRIARFTKEGDLQLENGWVVGKDYAHFDVGYVSTVYGAQGQTVDRVLIAQSAISAPAASREAWYVAVSRGREQVRVYTDSVEELRASVEKSGERLGAVELVQKGSQKLSTAIWDVLRRQVRQAEVLGRSLLHARFSAKEPPKEKTSERNKDRGREHE